MTREIGNWLSELGLGEYRERFVENEIDLDAARDLTEADLRELDIPMGPRKKLLRAIVGLTDGQFPLGREVQERLAEPQREAGERRQVTVLFADISGYTKLASELDAEQTHALLSHYFATVDGIVESYGGAVDKHIGDSVMAVFGAPVAHGNDVERAVRAALVIHAAMPSISAEVERPLEVHIGVASGQVVASDVGSDAHYTVTGDSVNLASRLTDYAGPTETMISQNVQRAVANITSCDDLGDLTFKGIVQPVQIFKLLGIEADASKGASRPFVGRRAEIQQFSAMLEACSETGAGQAIHLRGEAGIGKTRLTEEFEKLATSNGFECHRALVLDFGVGKGQDAMRSLVRSFLALPSRSETDARVTAAEQILAEGLLDRGHTIYLYDLLDLPQPIDMRSLYGAMDNARRNQGKRETAAALVRALSNDRPLLLIIEDIHWAHELILDHLAELARTVADQAAILVMTSRIEGDPLTQAWRSSIASTPLMTIDLRPLRRDDAMALAAEFFDTTTQFASSCVVRAEGNPLFLEQLLRNADSNAEDGVPGSVQSIVQARMDTLDHFDKQALQAASVLGQRFALGALRHLIDNPQYTCSALIDRHLVRPEREDYLFAHALVQEGVYSSLLTTRRTELHRVAAGWYSARDLVLRAEHLDRANDMAAAAAFYHATVSQIEALHFDSALRLADRGIELATDPDVKCDLLCLRGDALRNTGATEDSISVFESAVETASDDMRLCRAWIGMAGGLRVAGQQERALEALDKAEEAAVRNKLTSERSQIHYLRGNVYFPLGNLDGCLAEHEQALKFAREVGSAESEALALGGLGDAYYLRGHMRTACEQFRACIDVCQKHGFGRIEVANRHMVGWARIHLMEFTEAHNDALASINMAAEVSHHRAELLGLMLAGKVELMTSQNSEARKHLERGHELSRTLSASNFEMQTLIRLAQVNAAEGKLSQARDTASQAIRLGRKVGMTFSGPAALVVWAELSEDSDQRKAALQEAESILDSGCVSHNHMWFADGAIDLALKHGEWDQAEHFATRLEAYTQAQKLEWPDFLIAKARSLAALGRGDRSQDLMEQIIRLKETAERVGLKSAKHDFDQALKGIST
jgi:class 3 adenylate cyclase/predicted ATPase